MASIRGGAALIVAVVHALQVFVLPYFGLYGLVHLATSWLATYAVMAFFIVSGFMISQSVNRHRLKNGLFDVKGFLFARFLRIYPPLIAAILISAVVYHLISIFSMHGALSFRLGAELFLSRERVEFEWERLLPTLLLVYNVFPQMPPPLSINGPLWTLAFEWWFYMIAASGAALVSQKTPLRVLFILGVILLFILQPSGLLFWVLFLIWLAGFLMGNMHIKEKYNTPYFWHILFVLLFLCILGIFIAGEWEPIKYLMEPLQRLGNRAHLTMLFVSFIMAIALTAAIKKDYEGRIFIGVSKYSYTLYLIHFPLLLLAFSFLHPLLYPASWIISSIAGLLSLLVIIFFSANLARIIENRNWLVGFASRASRLL